MQVPGLPAANPAIGRNTADIRRRHPLSLFLPCGPVEGEWDWSISACREALLQRTGDPDSRATDAIWNPFASRSRGNASLSSSSQCFVCCPWNRQAGAPTTSSAVSHHQYRSPWSAQYQPCIDVVPGQSNHPDDSLPPDTEKGVTAVGTGLSGLTSLEGSATFSAPSAHVARRHESLRRLETMLNAMLRLWLQTVMQQGGGGDGNVTATSSGASSAYVSIPLHSVHHQALMSAVVGSGIGDESSDAKLATSSLTVHVVTHIRYRKKKTTIETATSPSTAATVDASAMAVRTPAFSASGSSRQRPTSWFDWMDDDDGDGKELLTAAGEGRFPPHASHHDNDALRMNDDDGRMSLHHVFEVDMKRDADVMRMRHEMDGYVVNCDCVDEASGAGRLRGSIGWNVHESRRYEGLTYQNRAVVSRLADANQATIDALAVLSPAVVAQHLLSAVQALELQTIHRVVDTLAPKALCFAGPAEGTTETDSSPQLVASLDTRACGEAIRVAHTGRAATSSQVS